MKARMWVCGAALILGCDVEDVPPITVVGTVYDAEPATLFSDPQGLAEHRLEGVWVEAWDLARLGSEGVVSVGEVDVSGGVGDFTLARAGVVEGMDLTLVMGAADYAPTVVTGTLPWVHDDYPWFLFFDGALFSEPASVMRERVAYLDLSSEVSLPDATLPGQGGLLYGQLISDGAAEADEEPRPYSGARVQYRVLGSDGAAGSWQDSLYLDDDLAPVEALETTSFSGVFYALAVPEGPLEVQVLLEDGSTTPPFRTLVVEDGLTWLAAFTLPGEQAPSHVAED